MASRKQTIEEILNSDGDDLDFDGFSSDSDISISSDSLDSETSDDEIEDNPVNPPLDEWTSQFSDITVNDFEGDNGPNLPDDFDPVSARPIDYFSLLFGMELFETIATHTNNYARWKLQETTDRNWIETTASEIRAYIGMEILMGICQYPEANMYWSKNRYLGHPGIADVMPRNRYSKIKQYFHVSDRQAEPARNSPAYDRLFKVRPIIDHVSNSFLQRYTLGQDVAIDEAMVKFTGKLSFRQYMPAKPIKRGIKIWMACDSNTSYLSRFQVYLGRTGNVTEHGLGFNVVTSLTDNLHQSSRHIFFDNFFTSVPLMEQLLENGLYACGTVRVNRKGFPVDLNKRAMMALDRSPGIFLANGNVKRINTFETKIEAQQGFIFIDLEKCYEGLSEDIITC